jgi:hypothetical protein
MGEAVKHARNETTVGPATLRGEGNPLHGHSRTLTVVKAMPHISGYDRWLCASQPEISRHGTPAHHSSAHFRGAGPRLAVARAARLGRLPGDIAMGNGNFSLYFPIVTCLLLSVAVSLVPWIINLTRYRSMIRGWPGTHGTPWSGTGRL